MRPRTKASLLWGAISALAYGAGFQLLTLLSLVDGGLALRFGGMAAVGVAGGLGSYWYEGVLARKRKPLKPDDE